MANKVFVSHINNRLDDVLQEGLEYINYHEIIKPGDTVFIKPNLTFPQWRPGVTTTPAMIMFLLDKFRPIAGKIYVGESDGGCHSFSAWDAFKGHGLDAIVTLYDAELVNLSEVEDITAFWDSIDCTITVPVMKVHAMTGVSLGLKNLWGCVPDTMRCLDHYNLTNRLHELEIATKTKMCIIDATYALNKHGPLYGEVVNTDMVIVGADVIETDFEAVRIMRNLGFTLKRTPLDYASLLLFHSRTLSKLAYDSPVSKLTKKLGCLLKTNQEMQIVRFL